MAISVSPAGPNTHHMALSQGATKVGLILVDSNGYENRRSLTRDPMPASTLKTYQGEQQYSDSEPPWTPIATEDWAGGMGSENFDRASNMYRDGSRANAYRQGEIVLGGQEVYTTGHRKQNVYWPWNDGGSGLQYNWAQLLTGGLKYRAVKFIASDNYTPAFVYLVLRYFGTAGSILLTIHDDNAGQPGAQLASRLINAANYEELVSHQIQFAIAPGAITSGTTYWLKVYAEGDAVDRWELLCAEYENPTSQGYESSDDVTYNASTLVPFWRCTEADKPFKAFFFRHKKAQYVGLTYRDGSTSKVFINGQISLATGAGSSTNTLEDTAAGWTVGEMIGHICEIIEGKGADQERNYRLITANTATELTLESDWDGGIDNTSVYVIHGTKKWTEITGHGFTGQITGLLSFQQIVYFCMGQSEDLKRMRRFVSGAAYPPEWVTEAGNKANLLISFQDETTGAMKVCRANNDNKIAKAPAIDGSGAGAVGNLVFAADIPVGEVGERITGMIAYGDTKARPWVFKEGSFFEMQADVPVRQSPDELQSVRDPRNGRVILAHDVYLYSSVLNKWQRIYSGKMDDVGPDTTVGLPADRQGDISAAYGSAGRYFLAFNAGPNRYSSLLVQTGQGWHEVWRAPVAGQEITGITVQSIPGDMPDRLWIACGEDLVWLPLAFNPYNYPTDQDYRFYNFAHESHVVSAWHYANLQDVYKFYNALKVATEGLTPGWGTTVAVDYQVDTDTTWKQIGVYTQSFSEEKPISSNYDVAGRRLRYRTRLQTNNNAHSPRVVAVVIEAITRTMAKYVDSFLFRVMDRDMNLLDQMDEMSADNKLTILKAFAASPLPVLIESDNPEFHNRLAFLESVPIKTGFKIEAENRRMDILEGKLLEIQA